MWRRSRSHAKCSNRIILTERYVKKKMQKSVGFPLFVSIWNITQGQSTPELHFKMASWLEQGWKTDNKRLLLMVFRSGGKSTIVGLFAAWLLYINPNLRIMVLAADHNLAKKMVRNVKRIIERHPLTKSLLPESKDQWASDRFTITRNLELRDPSVLARGITSNMTGSRADVIICDDVEVPNTSDSVEKRAELRERLSEINYVMVPRGMQLYVGTPHCFDTIYNIEDYLCGFDLLKIPVLDHEGNSAWEDRFSLKDIERIRKSAGGNKFISQMMLQPVDIRESRLNPDLLRFYDEEIIYSKELNALFVGGEQAVSASAWWDPSFGKGNNDKSVMAVVFTDTQGRQYLHRAVRITAEVKSDEDEATIQCRQVSSILKSLYIPSVALEINGIGRFLPSILRRELANLRVPCAVVEISSRRAKEARIIEAFDVAMSSGNLYAHESIKQSDLINEMRSFRVGSNSGFDDHLDAVAGALAMEPIRLKSAGAIGRQSWRNTGKTKTAKTYFEV